MGLVVPILLAAGHFHVAGRVVGGEDDLVVGARAERMGDVERERGAAALVAADELAVDPDPGRVVDGLAVQEHPLAGGRGEDGQVEGAAVAGVVAALQSEAGGRGLGRERDLDGAVELPSQGCV